MRRVDWEDDASSSSQFSLGTIAATPCNETIHYSRRSVGRRRRRRVIIAFSPLSLPLSLSRNIISGDQHQQTADTMTDRTATALLSELTGRKKQHVCLSLSLRLSLSPPVVCCRSVEEDEMIFFYASFLPVDPIQLPRIQDRGANRFFWLDRLTAKFLRQKLPRSGVSYMVISGWKMWSSTTRQPS